MSQLNQVIKLKTKEINIGLEFSDMPFGRYDTDGIDNGQRFRKEKLIPIFDEFDLIIINMDDALGYGSSFLDEAFAGLYRDENRTKEEIINKFQFNYSVQSVIDSIYTYIDEAEINKL
jgi:hypothetical protein